MLQKNQPKVEFIFCNNSVIVLRRRGVYFYGRKSEVTEVNECLVDLQKVRDFLDYQILSLWETVLHGWVMVFRAV